ncbi:MAG: PQQ-binding-like beta-propeller repeat protein [Rubripirellula sp.]
MWRFDATRSAASSNQLPQQLHPLWTQELSQRKQAWDDPLNLDLMTYDRVFEPIVMDGRLMVGFNDQNKLVAFDTKTGNKLWTVYTEAPVRLPPAGWQDRVFFCCDDGFLYCVEVASGKLLWKFSGAPNSQHALGNQRLTSAWPARGGPVVRENRVYFAASIWPFMGTFLYALDVETGSVAWINDSTGAQYIKQPHSAPSFAGVAPQGALVATKNILLVPGGRSVPAAFDRHSGEFRYFEINAGGKGTGGSFVTADEQHFYVHTRRKGTRAFKLSDGVKTAFMPSEPVLHEDRIYSAETESDQTVVRAYGADQAKLWEIPADGTGDLILVDSHLIAAGRNSIQVIRLPSKDRPAQIVKAIPVDEAVERLIVADKKLFAVTISGKITAFGEQSDAQAAKKRSNQQPLAASDESIEIATELLATGEAEGYAFWFGKSDSVIAQALAKLSPFQQFAIVDPSTDVIDTVRSKLDAARRYGPISVHHGDPKSFKAPQHVANMVFLEENDATATDVSIAQAYQSVRPFGGVLHVLTKRNTSEMASRIKAMNLEQAKVQVSAHGVIVQRVGALPGAADWTHQYGDVANTIKSNDQRVKLPLGVLWFGGSSNMDVLPRHGHGPPEQVIGGRLFIQGMNSLSARDVYTGRVLWKREFADLGTFDVYYDKTFDDTPLDPKYNQVHIPGANGRGTNYVATEDRVYLVEGSVCHVLDPATGKSLDDIRLPNQKGDPRKEWGYVGVYKDVLIAGFGFAKYRERQSLAFESDKELKASRAGFGSKSFDRAASIGLIGFDRRSGKVLWQVDANHSFWHNGIVAGGDQVYCLDRNPAQIEEALRRRGKSRPETYRILALNYRTGKIHWETNDDIFGTWLSYSPQHDVLLQAGSAASDRLYGESDRGMSIHSADDGSVRWKNKSVKYAGPCILHNDLIITNTNSYAESAGAFNVLTGKQKLVPHPLTGKMQPWKLTRAYGCNSIIASENMLTFRSGAAGYYDLLTNAGTGNLGGFKSGCTSNLVVAGGVLNAPDYTRTCSCAYQNQTSLALVHMPDVELWSVNSAAAVTSDNNRISSLGLNFGAPGDRRDANGRLWLEYPVSAGPSPPISIEMNEDASVFQSHSSAVPGELSWVYASGLKNLTELRVDLQLQEPSINRGGIPIDHASDDAEENEQGEVNLGSTDLELIDDGGTQLVGMRFNNIDLPSDSIIKSAHVQFTCDETSKQATSLIIAGEDTGNAKRFASERHDLSSRTLTSTEIGWSPPPWAKIGESKAAHRTPNLAPIIQSILSRPDWKPGNSLALLISGSGKRVASSWKKGDKRAAKLIIEADRPTIAIPNQKPVKYQVRLLFGRPRSTTREHVFDVYAQDKPIATDVALDSDHPTAIIEQEVSISKSLHLRLVAKQGEPVLSGIEFVRIEEESPTPSRQPKR